MVPQKCDGPCGRNLMIWDTHTFWCRTGFRETAGIGEVHLCDQCLPPANIHVEKNVKLNFIRPKLNMKFDPLAIDPPFEDEEFDPGFHGPEDGSADRFKKRAAENPWSKHMFWWFVHNAIAHFLISFLPWKPFFKFHDWTSRKMHGL